MKPILSRFCEIYIPEPTVNDKTINLYQYNLNIVFKMKDDKIQRIELLKKELLKSMTPKITLDTLMSLCIKLYEKSYCALDIMNLLEDRFKHASSSVVLGTVKVFLHLTKDD